MNDHPLKVEHHNTTSDGGSIASKDYEDRYFQDNGFDESKEVYIGGNNLEERWESFSGSCFTIGELGFGLGLNFLTTMHCWLKKERSFNLDYIGIDKKILEKKNLVLLEEAFPNLKKEINIFKECDVVGHNGFECISIPDLKIRLILVTEDVQKAINDICISNIDAWFLDGFDPKKNPEMWTEDVLKAVFDLSSSDSSFSSFTSVGRIRRALLENGFEVNKVPGFGTKRHRIVGRKFEENKKSLDIEYFDMENLYKTKDDYTANEIEVFIDENKDQLKREYIDFKYVILNPKNLIGIEEFNQEFFDEIDSIENKISQGSTFDTILEDINVDIIEVNEFAPSSSKQINEDLIYSKKTSKIDLIESGDNFLLYNIDNQYDRAPDLNDEIIKGEIVELIYQKGKFDYNREIIEEIQKKKFDNSKFEELAGSNKEYSSINSIEDDKLIDINSVKMLYALPVNSFALVNKEDKIYLVKITGTNKNSFNKTDEKYLKFVNSQNTNNRKSILQSYDQLLNDKYQVQLNQKTIDRVKNYFK